MNRKPKILSIDDESGFVALIKNYFSLRGYEVFTALRGITGLEIAKKQRPDVVLIDMKMPGIDGDQVLREMHSINRDIKCIIITAFKDEGQTRKKALDAGAYAYFEKPISSFKELEETVNDAVRGK